VLVIPLVDMKKDPLRPYDRGQDLCDRDYDVRDRYRDVESDVPEEQPDLSIYLLAPQIK
jgi:hypothetical protein